MSKNASLLVIFLFGILLLGIAALIPQRSAHALDCVDPMTKMLGPCPDTSRDKPGKKNRPTPVTIIPTLTPTSTDTPTSTPTFTPTPTYTPLPTATQPAAQLIAPVKLINVAAKCLLSTDLAGNCGFRVPVDIDWHSSSSHPQEISPPIHFTDDHGQ